MSELLALMPVFPEIVLAIGAMALLMFGSYGGERAAAAVEISAIVLLAAAAVLVAMMPDGRFGTSFVVDDFARFLKVLAFAGSAVAIVMSLDYLAKEKQQKFEYPILILLSTVGMGMLISAADLIALYLGLELMSLSLYVVAASNRDSVRSTEAGLEIFRARRAVVRHAALWLFAHLRLHRHGRLRRHRRSLEALRHRTDLRSGVSVRRFVLQGLGGAVPHVDARRLRRRAHADHRVLRRGAEDRGHRDLRARRDRRVPRHRAAMAADHRVRRHRFDDARRVCGDRPAQYQAADGLFLDRPHGFRAHRTCARHGDRRAGRADLHGDLSCHDAWHLRGDPLDAPRRGDGGADQRPLGASAHQSAAGVFPGAFAVFTGRHSAACGILRANSTCSSPRSKPDSTRSP